MIVPASTSCNETPQIRRQDVLPVFSTQLAAVRPSYNLPDHQHNVLTCIEVARGHLPFDREAKWRACPFIHTLKNLRSLVTLAKWSTRAAH